MDNIIELIRKNAQLFLENAEYMNHEEVEQEDIDEYIAIQGATEEELSTFENQFQIKLPENFKAVYRYKSGSGYISLSWAERTSPSAHFHLFLSSTILPNHSIMTAKYS